MPRAPIDLSSHINRTIQRGHPADFPIALRPIAYIGSEGPHPMAGRYAVVREDTGAALGVVSRRYRLVPHQELLQVVQKATTSLDVGPVPQGIYVDHGGARMRALFKFPSLARPVLGDDAICPCLKLENSYDGTSRITVHIGAFRFVCTNLAVGGGGAFAGGFMSLHVGDIAIDKVAEQLTSYLERFETIVALYRRWAGERLRPAMVPDLLRGLPQRAATTIGDELRRVRPSHVYAAYNVATFHATHKMRSFGGAFELLELVNRAFQEQFPVS